MSLALLAAAMLAPRPLYEPSMTAGQMYDGCARYAASASPPDPGDEGQAVCTLAVAALLAENAARAAIADTDSDTREFCLPESLAAAADGDETVAVVRLFIAYVDRNPASRSAGADETMNHALADTWLCPH